MKVLEAMKSIMTSKTLISQAIWDVLKTHTHTNPCKDNYLQVQNEGAKVHDCEQFLLIL